ncbi:hypothetical protein [Fulvivirga sediminis]|uniref:DUF4836 family protein n=1 Tax=Fulvivirga sediminis TaxID=2803949 RepID=A0A937FEC9_9BACT|nr:hypothetical protein [Fulvivirga sediminis]MBL3658848.1 hypothetical protein [Fulvivirga sediminis]
MKKLLFILALFSFGITEGQELSSYVPARATVVGSLNGSHIFKPEILERLNKTNPGRELLAALSDKLGYKVTSLDSVGINTSGTAYFYSLHTDSVIFTNFIFPLESKKVLDDIYKNKENVATGKYTNVQLSNGTYAAWDDEKLIMSMGAEVASYFYAYDFEKVKKEMQQQANDKPQESDYEMTESESLVYEEGRTPYLYNYSLQMYLNKYNSTTLDIIEKLQEGTIDSDYIESLKEQDLKNIYYSFENVDSIYSPDPSSLDKFLKRRSKDLEKEISQLENKDIQKELSEVIDNMTYYSDSFNISTSRSPYSGYYQVNSEEKDYLINKWTRLQINYAMYPASTPITKNKKYMDQFDSEAVINIWNGDMGDLLKQISSKSLPTMSPLSKNPTKIFENYGQISSNLYLNEKSAKIDFNVSFKDEFGESFKKMSDRKINKKFFKYMNEDELLGYMSYNFNMENTLKEYPDLLATQYGDILGSNYMAEAQMLADVFTLVVDEEALGDLIKGDALFLVSSFEEKEYTYTGYEYDEDYNYKEVTKTKKETLPNFLFMLSTESPEFTDKLINYLLVKDLVSTTDEGFYHLKAPKRDIPMDLFFMIKNDIFFLGTSAEDMSAIKKGTYKGSLSKKHKKLMRQGNYSLYFNSKALLEQIPSEKMHLSEKKEQQFTYMTENATDFYIKSSKFKNNTMHSELIMEVPDKHVDAATYLLDLIDHLSR